MAKESERLVWAVEELRIEPSDRVLEVGCGHGAASRRNHEYVDAGRASFESGVLQDADFGDERFDAILALHVAAFYRDPAPALPIARDLLAPGGRLGIFSQAPGWTAGAARDFADSLTTTLRAHGLEPRPLTADLSNGPAAGALAK